MTQKPEFREFLFLLTAFLHLTALLGDLEVVVMVTKVLLMPLLIWWVWPFTSGRGFLRFAMFASWLGDVLLIRSEEPLFFMTGLGSFLLAQLSYATAFTKAETPKKGLLQIKPWLALPVLLIAVLIYGYISPSLGELRIPVSVYVGAITAMMLSAIHRRTRVPSGNTVLIFAALSFMVSDALLAVNKFVVPLPYASFWIMLTYILAQYGIAKSWQIGVRSRD